ncbi:thioesterase II family protein [Streptomyces sp. x-19]|uniref:thioesterase II family protein n=1 Tax=Streptomyces sp. x-19 TaxID=2789280 RepID=UPI0039816139
MTGASATSAARWLRRFHPIPEEGPRLVRFPHAGGSASYYFKLSRVLHPSPACPVLSLVGTDDPQATTDEASAWAGHTDGPFTLRVFDGGHFYPDTHTDEIADVIRSTAGGMS